MLFNLKSLLDIFLVFITLFTSSSFAQTSEIRILSDIAYGKSEEQVLDVY